LQRRQRPGVEHQRRREAEADQVRQRVVLHAEFALRAGQARDAPVQPVQDGGHEHGDGRLGVAPADTRHDRVIAGEHRAGREQVRQQVDSARRLARSGRARFHVDPRGWADDTAECTVILISAVFPLYRAATDAIQSPIRRPLLRLSTTRRFPMKRSWPLLVLLAACLPAMAADMYSWTDASGARHFSDSPPPASAKAQKIKFKGGVTSNEEAEPAEPGAEPGPSLAAAAGYSAEDIKRNCEIARGNLSGLEGQKVTLDADGFPVDLDAAKSRQEQIDKANQQIKLFCTN